MAPISTAYLSIDDVFTTKRGSKIARVLDAANIDTKHCVYMPGVKLRAPFDASTFDKNPDAMRLNLQLSLENTYVRSEIETFEVWLKQYLAAHSDRIFKKHLSLAEIEVGYTSCMRESDTRPTLLKVKIDREGFSPVRCWDPQGEAMSPPESWKNLLIEARIHISHLWCMGAQFGVVMQLTDAKIHESPETALQQRANPF